MWSDPIGMDDLAANGGIVSVVILNREVRDNLRFLHSSPRARAIADADQTIDEQKSFNDPPKLLDFPRTLEDNWDLHGSGFNPGNQPVTAAMRFRIPGTWLISASVGFASMVDPIGVRIPAITRKALEDDWPSGQPGGFTGMLTRTVGPTHPTNALSHEVSLSFVTAGNAVDTMAAVAVILAKSDTAAAATAESNHRYAPSLAVHWLGDS